MTIKKIAAAFTLLLVVGLAAPAFAQEDWYPGTPTQQADPSPVNPVQKVYEDGKIIVATGSVRHFGYHIGDIIPLRIVIAADPGVHINIEGIQRGLLATAGSDFELAGKPTITRGTMKGKEVIIIDLQLVSWVLKTTLVFNADFHYATELLPDGKSPNWKAAATPDFVVTTSNTATESSKELIEIDQSAQSTPLSRAVWPLRLVGALFLLALPGLLAWRLYRRVFPPRVVPPHELAWSVFDRVAEEGRFGGLKTDHVQEITHALRRYLQVETLSLSEMEAGLEAFFARNPERAHLVAVATGALSRMERALYTKQGLSPAECEELFGELEQLVPRP